MSREGQKIVFIYPILRDVIFMLIIASLSSCSVHMDLEKPHFVNNMLLNKSQQCLTGTKEEGKQDVPLSEIPVESYTRLLLKAGLRGLVTSETSSVGKNLFLPMNIPSMTAMA